MTSIPDPTRQYATLTFMRGAMISLAIAMFAGLISILYYVPGFSDVIERTGMKFTSLRPIHTVFAVAFIILGGVSVVHRYFEDIAGPISNGERFRLHAQVYLWAIAGAGIIISLIMGVFSGREYLGFHPVFSIPIMLGWLLFVWNFFGNLGKGLLSRPMHATMWAVGALLFIYTFSEQYAWLIPGIFEDPLRDMRIQWKAGGTLVGSFNLFVYGALYFIGCNISKDTSYAHSRLAYALFGVGLLNSFTNFGHHTYHLPQDVVIKWISFVISMTEIILLARVVWDIAAMIKRERPNPPCTIELFMNATKWWTAYILASAIIISIPPINALIHGTTVVWAHGMGAAIGIDTMVLFAAISWILFECLERANIDTSELSTSKFRRRVLGFNISMAALIGWLTIGGIIAAIYRYQDLQNPQWFLKSNPWVLGATGLISFHYLSMLVNTWLVLLFRARVNGRSKTPIIK